METGERLRLGRRVRHPGGEDLRIRAAPSPW
jgi:hypothetical protein